MKHQILSTTLETILILSGVTALYTRHRNENQRSCLFCSKGKLRSGQNPIEPKLQGILQIESKEQEREPEKVVCSVRKERFGAGRNAKAKLFGSSVVTCRVVTCWVYSKQWLRTERISSGREYPVLLQFASMSIVCQRSL